MKTRLTFILLVFTLTTLEPAPCKSQDTLNVMHYNILKYGDPNCEKNNEDQYFREIIRNYKPDILTVNELAADNIYAQRIKNKVLNRVSSSEYKKASYTNRNGSSNIVNMLFYNSEKLGLKSQSVSNTQLRDINHYRLFYKNPDLSGGSFDTVFFNISTMHLKAGGDQNDEAEREAMTQNMMDHLARKNYEGYYVATGDFNISSSNDKAYQNLVTPGSGAPANFEDPLNKPGTWRKNSSFSDYHTQSTRSSNIGDCGVPGGMDDRFDFILLDKPIMNNEEPVYFEEGSYQTIGQDGNRFNQSITSPSNQEVSASLANALKRMSDHLPVSLNIVVDQPSSSSNQRTTSSSFKSLVKPNPFDKTLTLSWQDKTPATYQVELTSITGEKVINQEKEATTTSLNTTRLKPGIYFLVITKPNGDQARHKLIKR